MSPGSMTLASLTRSPRALAGVTASAFAIRKGTCGVSPSSSGHDSMTAARPSPPARHDPMDTGFGQAAFHLAPADSARARSHSGVAGAFAQLSAKEALTQ